MRHFLEQIDWLALQRTFSTSILTRSVLVAIVVGTILNAINQGSEILNGEPVNITRLLLTYAVPFFVASYGAFAALSRLDSLTGSKHSRDDEER